MAIAIQAAADTRYEPAAVPTMYFIGVTTGKSSIMTVFPRWAEHLGLRGAVIRGIDCKWHDRPEVYRRAVEFIKHDPLSLGALVTTHKIDL
jgi:shikimate 5-dehydrogenase